MALSFRNEAEFEEYFVEQVENSGGKCMKCNPNKMGKGIPDRLVSFDDTFGLVELKNPNGTGIVTPEQKERLKKFENNGIRSYIIDCVKDIPKVIYEIQNYKDSLNNLTSYADSEMKSKKIDIFDDDFGLGEHEKEEIKKIMSIQWTELHKEMANVGRILEKIDHDFFWNNPGLWQCYETEIFYGTNPPSIAVVDLKDFAWEFVLMCSDPREFKWH